MLVLHKLVDLAKGDLRQGHSHLRKEQAQIQGITRDGVCRELSTFQIRPKPVQGSLADVIHGLPPLQSLVLFDLGHRLVILGAFGAVIELGIAERHVEGAMPHQLFDHFQ